MTMIDKRTGGFESLGEFLVAVRKFCTGEHHDARIAELKTKTMTEGVDSAGGFTVPGQHAEQIFNVALEDAIVRPRAIVLSMGRDTLDVANLVDSNRSTSIFGGITFTWIEEAADKSTYVSEPKLGQIKLAAKEGIACGWVSNQLEDDTKNFENFFKLAFGKAVGFYEDVYYIWGNGVGQPLGIMASNALLAPARSAVGLVNIADLGILARRLLPGSWKNAPPGSSKNAVWLINQDVLAQWVDMQATAANVSSILDLKERRCLGCDVIPTEKCSPLGTRGDIILADFSHYVIGNRSLIVSASRHVPGYFQKNQTFWKLEIRIDGTPGFTDPITPYKGTNTLSAFVTLDSTS
jgi:HK97 family phage major capsid protein